MATRPGFANPRCLLEVDGVAVGSLKSFSGLSLQADLAVVTSGTQSAAKKHVASVKWTPGKASVGMAMGKGLYGWIKDAMEKGNSPRGGSLKRVDANFHVKASLGFKHARITELSVPKLDGASKEPGFFDVGFEAEEVLWDKSDGSVVANKIEPKAKAWLCANFAVQIGDLPCTRVATVDSFSWLAASADTTAGATVPDLKLSISGADYPAWAEAARKWFIDGLNGEANEMGGRISFLSPTLKESDALGSIELFNVGFKKFNPIDASANSEQVERFTVELYVERMLISIKEFEA
jgi:hypothetical protein